MEDKKTMPPVLRRILKNNAAVDQLNHNKGPLPMVSYMEEAMVLAESWIEHPRSILVVKENLYHAQRLYERLATLLPESACALFSADESLRVEAIAVSPEMRANQIETLSSLLEKPDQIVVTSPSGFLRLLPTPETFRDACIHLKAGDTCDMEELKRKLRAGGYFQASHIDQPLSFASRGGIVDVYSINYENPVRIEFFGDEIDSIRYFSADTQSTIAPLQEVRIVPASSFLLNDAQVKEILTRARAMLEDKKEVIQSGSIENDLEMIEEGMRDQRLYPYSAFLSSPAGIWDYLDHPQIVYSDVSRIETNAKHLLDESVAYIQEMVEEEKLLPKFSVWHELSRAAQGCSSIEEDPYAENTSNLEPVHLPNEPLSVKLRILLNGSTVVFALNEKEENRLRDQCKEDEIILYETDGTKDLVEGSFNLFHDPLAEGIHDPVHDITIVTSEELFEIHHHSGRYERKFRSAEVIHSFEDLEPGDYVVHSQYGVGQYMGIVTREIQGTKRDFLHIIYRGNGELYVPLEQFRLVRKFVSSAGVVPRLNKLGTNEWEKTKKRLEENVNQVADRLVNLYAVRTEHIGHAFQKDSPLQTQFENNFEYELTPDQAAAVADVKADMESNKPMDRLVCGDVGFGKTEVAIRAAFKAVAENKQVAVLCPTTILAEQHVKTFSKRFEGFPFTIRALDRYVPEEKVKETLRGLKDGTIDIIIGTHRLLSKDVQFHDLGLLVVDEEQRFGVMQKEKIKEIKEGVDVLTLSATPIPRTLQMSLVGIRSMSQLETPPNNRYNVQTYVVEKNQSLIVDAIEKELARDGQVFYLYNNIDNITAVARNLQVAIPDARIGVAHGRMDRETIEDVMMQFTRHEINVLVCTTIIENGIDIPNANTIIIDNAQNFGLAQMYQIKGRVGRSDRIAYAYLMTPPRRQLNETAEKRLQAVKEFAQLGSGYRIAMRDLTIRGAGDLLGENQSGFIDTVGIDMYIEMLEQAIQRRQGKQPEKQETIRHAMTSTTSYIPKEFAPDDYDKISMYQNIDALHSVQELESYKKEVTDQYGHLPKEVNELFEKRRLDILVNDPDVESYREIQSHGRITFSTLFSQKVDGVKLFKIMTGISKDLNLRYTGGRILIDLPKTDDAITLACNVIQQSKKAYKEKTDAD